MIGALNQQVVRTTQICFQDIAQCHLLYTTYLQDHFDIEPPTSTPTPHTATSDHHHSMIVKQLVLPYMEKVMISTWEAQRESMDRAKALLAQKMNAIIHSLHM
jgi:hypothetical protein